MRLVLSRINILLCTLGLYGFDFLLICRLLFQVYFIRTTTLIVLRLNCVSQSFNEFIRIQRNTVYNISKTTLRIDGEVVITEANHTTFRLNLADNFFFSVDNILATSFYLINVTINISDTNNIDLVLQ